MQARENVEHHFTFTADDKPGRSFLGCPKCWYRLPQPYVTNCPCPVCGTKLDIFTVQPSDLEISNA